MHPLAKLDHQFVWHPFTQMHNWLKREPVVIAVWGLATMRPRTLRDYQAPQTTLGNTDF